MTAVRLAPEEAAFYASQSPFSDPGALAGRYAGLPADVGELARVVRDMTVHRLEGGLLDFDLAPDRLRNDAETRYVDDILRLIVARDDAPLDRRRDLGDRFVGVCRDFTLLHVSMLRHAGIPARLRSGFADYFGTDGFHHDHVVTEFWAGDRGWVLADAQLADPDITGRFPVDFDPLDVPRDRFLVAGAAWCTIREGGADPLTFGVLPDGPLAGQWFVAGNVRLDLAALNKTETLLWDVWGAGAGDDEGMTDEIRDLYDEAARVTCGDVPFETARKLFTEHDGLRTPETVLCVAPFNGPSQVTLR